MVFKVPNFFPEADRLREHFESLFGSPHSTNPQRFTWDLWKAGDQFYNLRTPAKGYFPKTLFRRFENHLEQWACAQLGTKGLSFVWLTCYVENCYQAWHKDQPHGPWAFVYALTPKRRQYKGGETLIKTPNGLASYPSLYNQLLVFDPDLVHSVSPVHGKKRLLLDPMNGRLVIHGWLLPPPLRFATALTPQIAERTLAEFSEHVGDATADLKDLSGWLVVEAKWRPDGTMKMLRFPTSTLKIGNQYLMSRELLRLQERLTQFNLPKTQSQTSLTIPLRFTNVEPV